MVSGVKKWEPTDEERAMALYLWEAKERSRPKITYRELADRTGIPYDSLTQILTGSMQITVREFARIATALGVSPDEAVALLFQVSDKGRP